MGLGALEFAEGLQPGIAVIEMHDKADGAEILAPVIHEEAAAGVIVQRPAHAVQHQALCDACPGGSSQSSFRPMPNFCGSRPSAGRIAAQNF